MKNTTEGCLKLNGEEWSEDWPCSFLGLKSVSVVQGIQGLSWEILPTVFIHVFA